LYGLKISNSSQFKELLNAGALGNEDEKIILELHFTGKVLNEEQQYVLTRTYMLNTVQQPVEAVGEPGQESREVLRDQEGI
jgi:DNA sulfur modification protein DndD